MEHKQKQNLLQIVEKQQLNPNVITVKIGDTVSVAWIISQENKRIQTFKGIVIAKKGTNIRQTITVRSLQGAKGEKVEKTFPIHSPLLKQITIDARAKKIRKAKLYYIRSLTETKIRGKLKSQSLFKKQKAAVKSTFENKNQQL